MWVHFPSGTTDKFRARKYARAFPLKGRNAPDAAVSQGERKAGRKEGRKKGGLGERRAGSKDFFRGPPCLKSPPDRLGPPSGKLKKIVKKFTKKRENAK